MSVITFVKIVDTPKFVIIMSNIFFCKYMYILFIYKDNPERKYLTMRDELSPSVDLKFQHL